MESLLSMFHNVAVRLQVAVRFDCYVADELSYSGKHIAGNGMVFSISLLGSLGQVSY